MTEESESYTVAQIREAFAKHARPDDWGVPDFYEDGLIAALRGEYDSPNEKRARLGITARPFLDAVAAPGPEVRTVAAPIIEQLPDDGVLVRCPDCGNFERTIAGVWINANLPHLCMIDGHLTERVGTFARALT